MSDFIIALVITNVIWFALGINGYLPNKPEVGALIDKCELTLTRDEICVLAAIPLNDK